MTQFTKKPVTINAFQMTETRRRDNSEWPQWLNEAWNSGVLFPVESSNMLAIKTLEGEHAVSWGDWIIQGVKGELYPCKPDIFEKTYLEYSPKTFLTPQDIEDAIISEHYFDAYDARQGSISSGNYQGRERPLPDEKDLSPLKQLTFCVLILKNGAKVVGINYGSIDPARHKADMGVIEARKDAVNKVWELMGYELKGKIHAANSV